VDTSCPPTVAQRRKQLVEPVQASKDKLFLIFLLRPGYKLRSWHLVQVDEEETNWRKAKAEGMYHVKYYVKCYADSKKHKGKDCAYTGPKFMCSRAMVKPWDQWFLPSLDKRWKTYSTTKQTATCGIKTPLIYSIVCW
jgi:hypothetical protein